MRCVDQAMSFANGGDRTVRVSVTPLNPDKASFKLVSKDAEDPQVWHTHMTGTLRKSEMTSRSAFSTKQIRERCQQTLSIADFYDRLNKLGLEYGPGFRGVQELYLGQNETLTKVKLPDGLANTQYLMHPAFLDACLHAYPLVLDGMQSRKQSSPILPAHLAGRISLLSGWDRQSVGAHQAAHRRERRYAGGRHSGSDDTERPVADLEDSASGRLPLGKVQQPQASADDLFYRPVWRKSVRRTVNSGDDGVPASWIIFADARSLQPWPASWKLRGIIATSSAGAAHLSDNMPERGP